MLSNATTIARGRYLEEGLIDVQHGEVVALGHRKLPVLSGLLGGCCRVMTMSFYISYFNLDE